MLALPNSTIIFQHESGLSLSVGKCSIASRGFVINLNSLGTPKNYRLTAIIFLSVGTTRTYEVEWRNVRCKQASFMHHIGKEHFSCWLMSRLQRKVRTKKGERRGAQ